MATIAKPPFYKVTATQLIVTALISGLLLTTGIVNSYSYLIGCLIHISGSVYFSRLAYKYQGARQAKSMVQAMYAGASGKIIISAVFFALVFVFVKPLSVIFVFVGYLLMLLIHSYLVAQLLKQNRSTFSR